MNRRKMAAAALTASLIGGGAAAALTGLPAAIAQTATEAPAGERGGWVTDALAPLVENNTITQAQADAVRQALLDAKPVRGGPGPVRLEVVAEAIGIDADDLRSALRDGQTIAEVAEANGVTADAVVAALVAALEEHLDERVAGGDMTQERADEILAEAPERITAVVNGEAPAGGRGPGFHGPRGFGGGPRG